MDFRIFHNNITYLKWLRIEKIDIDLPLTIQETILSRSLNSLVNQKLRQARLFMFWCVSENFFKISKIFYNKIPSILKKDFYRRKREEIRQNASLIDVTTKEKAENIIINVLQDLSKQLNKRTHFLKNLPSSLDAIITGELILLFYSETHFNCIQRLKNIENLYNFLFIMMNTYFKDFIQNLTIKESMTSEKKILLKIQNKKVKKFIREWYSSWIFVLTSISAVK